MITFCVLGGDARTEYMTKCLEKSGFKIYKAESFYDIRNFDAVILPLPFSSDNIRIKGTDITIDNFLNSIDSSCTVFIGKANEYVSSVLNNKNILFYDYNSREEFAQKNSVPTAQGVLSFVLNNINVTVNSLKIAVIGYGRCGKAICKIFKSLGSDVISFSRRYSTVADAESEGLKAYLIKDIKEKTENTDIIINTVPAKILDREFIDNTDENTILIDVSSYPYGFDTEYASSAGRNINILSSLPGKCVPETAGNIIAETIINIIEEGGLWKKSN